MPGHPNHMISTQRPLWGDLEPSRDPYAYTWTADTEGKHNCGIAFSLALIVNFP